MLGGEDQPRKPADEHGDFSTPAAVETRNLADWGGHNSTLNRQQRMTLQTKALSNIFIV